jgi:predicted ATPase
MDPALAEIAEQEVLGGSVNFKPRAGDLGLGEAFFSYAKGRELEVQAASSMVRELAPVLLCLKGGAWVGDWFVIDEPEMNLHPRAQAAVAEFLCLLVNSGLRVLISTHSPYIVDHVANLIAGAKDSDKKGLAEHFYLRRADAFIEREKVSISLFDKGTVTNILTEDGNVDWGTFSDVSTELRHIYAKILARRKKV